MEIVIRSNRIIGIGKRHLVLVKYDLNEFLATVNIIEGAGGEVLD